jgi:hypothetical protein
MLVQPRFVSRMIGVAAAVGLTVLMSGVKAQASSASVTTFSYTGSPSGYYDVTDTVNVGITFYYMASSGSYGYGIIANYYYYSGPYASGTLLGSGSRGVYSSNGAFYSGTSTISNTVYVNTPDLLRASEPAGTQSILYVYSLQGGGGCYGWSGPFSAGGSTAFVVHG